MLIVDHAQSKTHLATVDPVAIVERCFRLNDGRHIRQPDPPTWGLGIGEFGTRMRFKGCFIDTVPICGFRLTSLTDDRRAEERAMRWVLLVEPQTGAALGLIDEHALYPRRVAAAVAVGLRAVARTEPATIGVIGAGRLARTTLTSLGELFPGCTLSVASRSHSRASELAASIGDRARVEALPSAKEIMRRCDVVVTATSSSAPVVDSTWARPGQILCTLGRHELPDEIYANASAMVASDRVISAHAPDVRALVARKVVEPGSLFAADVGELLRGETTLPDGVADGVVVYRCDGFVAQDVLLAHAVWAQARGPVDA